MPKGATPYKGQLSAPMPSMFSNQLSGLLGSFSGGANDFWSMTKSAVDQVLSGTPSYQLNPEITKAYFEKGVAAPALELFDRSIAPRIKEAYASVGNAFNTRVGNSISDALMNLQTNLSGQLAGANLQNQQLEAQLAESAKQRQLQGAQTLSFLPLQGAQMLQQLGFNQQGLAQNALDRKYREFLRTSPESNPWIAMGLPFLGQQAFGYGPSTLSSTVSGLGNIMGLIGGGMGLGQAFGMFQSPLQSAMGTNLGLQNQLLQNQLAGGQKPNFGAF